MTHAMKDSTTDAIAVLRERGFVAQITDEAELASRLRGGRVTFYVGFDPTASSLHVGSLVPLMAMAHLARCGHRPIALLGGGTAMVGDPSGKTELRKLLTQEDVEANKKAIGAQIRRFLNTPDAIVVDNADWLLSLKYIDFLRDVGRHFSVNRMLTAEAYRLRLEKGLSFLEFNYQLLQAYDFLVLNQLHDCTLQIGGDDQWGNIVAGIDLVRRMRQSQVHGLTFPLLTTSTGAKMGKTASGAIWLDAGLTPPFDVYQYFVNVDDADVIRLLKLLTFISVDEIRKFDAVEGAELREAKRMLARGVTTILHGEEAAERADAAARAAFGGAGGLDEEALPTFGLDAQAVAAGLKVVDVLASCGLAASKSAARRLIEQGGVRLGARKIASVEEVIVREDVAEGGALLHAGKKHVRRLLLSGG